MGLFTRYLQFQEFSGGDVTVWVAYAVSRSDLIALIVLNCLNMALRYENNILAKYVKSQFFYHTDFDLLQ